MIVDVFDNPALPEFWAANQKGMAASVELTGDDLQVAKLQWNAARRESIHRSQVMSGCGLHKGLANRRLEADMHITELVTGSDKGFANFFALRAHPAAQPEFQVLAYRMLAEYIKSVPQGIGWGEWHIPKFGGELLAEEYFVPTYEDPMRLIKIATARCARLSYLTFDGEHSPEKDIELHDRLLTSGHFSPFEHCAKAVRENRISNFDCIEVDDDSCEPGLVGIDGRCGWEQYRKTLPNENQTSVDLAAIMATKPEWISIP